MKMNSELKRNLLFDLEVVFRNGRVESFSGWDWDMCINHIMDFRGSVECGTIKNYEKNVMVIFYKSGNRLKLDDLGNFWTWD